MLSDDRRDEIVAENRQLQDRLVTSYQQRDMELVSYQHALENRFPTDWSSVEINRPQFTGINNLNSYPLEEIAEYIDWSPFFMTWELKGKFPKIFDDPVVGDVARELYDNAREMLQKLISDRRVNATGVYGFWPAASDGDDVIVYQDERRDRELARFYMLRQQWQRKGQEHFRSLADYIAPIGSGREDYIGGFAVTAGIQIDQIAAEYEKDHDDYNSIMVKALADRLAEAFAELLHHRARADWGYGTDSELSMEDIVKERYRGYPAGTRLSGVSRSHPEENALADDGCTTPHRHHVDRVLRHVAWLQCLRTLLRPPRIPILRHQPHRSRPTGRLRQTQKHVIGRNARSGSIPS